MSPQEVSHSQPSSLQPDPINSIVKLAELESGDRSKLHCL